MSVAQRFSKLQVPIPLNLVINSPVDASGPNCVRPLAVPVLIVSWITIQLLQNVARLKTNQRGHIYFGTWFLIIWKSMTDIRLGVSQLVSAFLTTSVHLGDFGEHKSITIMFSITFIFLNSAHLLTNCIPYTLSKLMSRFSQLLADGMTPRHDVMARHECMPP